MLVGSELETGGIDHPKAQPVEPTLALDAVAGDPRQIVDERPPPSDQTVKEGGLADVGTAEDGNRAHIPDVGSTSGQRKATTSAESVSK